MSHQVSQTGSQSVQNVPSVYSLGQNGPASVSHFQHFSQTGSHNVQTPHNYNVPNVYSVGLNGPASVFQLQNVSQSGSQSRRGPHERSLVLPADLRHGLGFPNLW